MERINVKVKFLDRTYETYSISDESKIELKDNCIKINCYSGHVFIFPLIHIQSVSYKNINMEE